MIYVTVFWLSSGVNCRIMWVEFKFGRIKVCSVIVCGSIEGEDLKCLG